MTDRLCTPEALKILTALGVLDSLRLWNLVLWSSNSSHSAKRWSG
jgi:hypothetical protein